MTVDQKAQVRNAREEQQMSSENDEQNSAEVTAPTRRLKACVETWPDCVEGDYNPACCRFPKSCSCEVYDFATIADERLEPMTTEPAGEHHTGSLDLTGEGNVPASPISDEAIAEIAGRMFDGDLVRQPQRVQDRVWRDAHAALEAAYPAIRQQVAEEIAGKANEIAEAYQKSAEYYRAIALEVGSGEPKGQRYMRTALSFKNNAAGAWAVMHAARDIGGDV